MNLAILALSILAQTNNSTCTRLDRLYGDLLFCAHDHNGDKTADHYSTYLTDLQAKTWTHKEDYNADGRPEFIEKYFFDARGFPARREVDRNGDGTMEETFDYVFDDKGNFVRETHYRNGRYIPNS